MNRLHVVMIATITLAPIQVFAQGGSSPEDGGPGSISAGGASTPELVPWTTQPRKYDLPTSVPAGVDPRSGQTFSTFDPPTTLPVPNEPEPPAR